MELHVSIMPITSKNFYTILLALDIIGLYLLIVMGEANPKLMKVIKFIFGVCFMFLLAETADALLETQLFTLEVIKYYANTVFFVICVLWGIMMLKYVRDGF